MMSWPLALIALFLAYTGSMFLRSRRTRFIPVTGCDRPFVVYVVPCLNEELVLGACLDRFIGAAQPDSAMLVVDDGSTDRTLDIALDAAERCPGVWVLHRELPDAQLGKGAALNAGLEWLRTHPEIARRDPAEVIVTVLDGDGRLASNALAAAVPYFADPSVGAVQIGVRMYNADDHVLARMQDMEFVCHTDIFQRGRHRIGSVGLGGNGQFCRLSALIDLGPEPWSDCLTEDLDIGLRLLARGWTNHYCPTTHVSQQAVTDTDRLIRQRTRWFQGNLQCAARIPEIATSRHLRGVTAADLCFSLALPWVILALTVPMAATLLAVAASLLTGSWTVDFSAGGAALFALVSYGLTFGLAPVFGFVYWLRTPRYGLVRSFLVAHVFCLYGYLWMPAGWRAVGRMLSGRTGWAKTARTAGAPSTSSGTQRMPTGLGVST